MFLLNFWRRGGGHSHSRQGVWGPPTLFFFFQNGPPTASASMSMLRCQKCLKSQVQQGSCQDCNTEGANINMDPVKCCTNSAFVRGVGGNWTSLYLWFMKQSTLCKRIYATHDFSIISTNVLRFKINIMAVFFFKFLSWQSYIKFGDLAATFSGRPLLRFAQCCETWTQPPSRNHYVLFQRD